MTPFEIDELLAERAELEASLLELRPVIAEVRRIERRLRALERMQAGEIPVRPHRIRRYLSTEERKLQILTLLERRPGLRRKDVAEELGLTRARAGQLVNMMVADGLVDDRGPEGLLITDTGRRLLDERHPERPVIDISQGPVTIRTERQE